MMNVTADSTRFWAMREAMVVSQLRPSAVDDRRLIEAMTRVPREDFLPEDVRALAYRDRPLPLGEGRAQNAPLATARLINEARIGADDRVLLIGAAGGYTAAVLAELAHGVVAVEESPALVAIARAALGGNGKVEIVEGPLAAGAPNHEAFDVIVIDGAVEAVPDALITQAKEGARIATGLIDRGVSRLAAGSRTAGGFGLFDFADVDCVVLPGFEKPRTFKF